MPLYTFRTRLGLDTPFQRGAPYAEMSHHFTFPNDQAAIDALPGQRDRFKSSAIERRFVVRRGVQAHETVAYRRSLEDRKSWHKVGAISFSLPEWQPQSWSIPITDTPVDPHLVTQFAHIWPDSRGAVLVEERGASNLRKRTYVGPISPVALVAEFDTLLPDWWPTELGAEHVRLWVPYLVLGDFPHEPPAESLQLWRTDMAELARDHIYDMQEYAAETGGEKVVVSWKHSSISPVIETVAQLGRAELRSRGVQAGTTGPKPD